MPWNDPSPYKDKARIAVKQAVTSGRLIKPPTCSNCLEEAKLIHAHHDDYDKPLNIIWLCVDCHVDRHTDIKKYGKGAVLELDKVYEYSVPVSKKLIIPLPSPAYIGLKKSPQGVNVFSREVAGKGIDNNTKVLYNN